MKIKLLAITLAYLIVATSCSDFLDQQPLDTLTGEQVFGKMDNIEPTLRGAFVNWRNLQKDRQGLYTELGSDEAQQGTYQILTDANQGGLDLYNGFLQQENTAVSRLWTDRWPMINTASNVIYYLATNTEEDAERRESLIAKSHFLRASLMFEMAMYWGEIPIVGPEYTDVYGYARQPLSDVYTVIVEDLEMAIDKLPTTQDDPIYPTKWIAQALLGKVYMSAQEDSGFRDYNLAKQMFEGIINSGQFSLMANYANLFDPLYANNQESLYEWQFNNNWPDNNQLQWQAGSRALANIDGNCYFGGYDLLMPTQYCYNLKTAGGIWETGDTRKDASIRYNFNYQGINPTLPAGFGGDELNPHIKKYEDYRTQSSQSFWYSGKNKAYIRYADVLLSYAECLNELGQTSQAETYVNQVRTRAFGGNLPAAMAWSGLSQNDFRTQILDERMRELAFEGWRRMDLLRTGKLVELAGTRNKWAQENGTLSDFHKRYPIPLSEINQNDEINDEDQNPGY